MKLDIGNISYDLIDTDGVDHADDVLHTLPTADQIEIDVGDDDYIIDQIAREIEQDWLVRGFEYRIEGEKTWHRHDDDMAWRHDAQVKLATMRETFDMKRGSE